MNAFVISLVFSLIIPPIIEDEPDNVCKMTYFGGKDDKWRGGVTPCLGRRVSSYDWGIAMRGGKCGDLVWLQNPRTGNSVVVPIIDHGPYGAGSKKDGTWYVRTKRDQAHPETGEVLPWRGCGDLTKPVSRALGHNGFEKIRWERL